MTGDIEMQLRLAREQLRQRAHMGDRLEVARQVDHSAEFSRKRHAEAAAADLRALSYEVTVSRRGFKALLEATKATAVDAATAEAFVREVVEIVTRHEGSYDGWGGVIAEVASP